MKTLLNFDAVGFRYGERQVLADVSFTLEEGSCTALIGPNGAGKTTLLRLGAGSLKPSSGSVLIESQPPAEMPHRLRSRLVALVPQQLDVPFDFTVNQIVEQGRTPYLGLLRGPGQEDRIAVDRALEYTDTIHFRNRIYNELSGGERQRVKVALGLAQGAKILLLDEPTQNLDIGRQSELIDLLQRLRGEGITILASIHDLHLVAANFSSVHLLGPNHSFISGPPAEVLTAGNLSKSFHFNPARKPPLYPHPYMHEGQ